MTDQSEPARNDIHHMREAVLFDGPSRNQRISRFWVLLILAALIASAGVVGDSTATVIGAMIVAPMMLPIQGTMLSTVLGDRRNLTRSIALMIAGSLAAIMVGYLVGLVVPNDVVAATNAQVASRVSPDLIDLLAALSTGVVGSVALVRRDISDTLPGVAIAISLVPPLCVVGLTLESAAYLQALGALLLYVTNVAAILATGVVVMTIYRVQTMPEFGSGAGKPVNQRRAVLVIAAMLVIVAVPLTYSTITFGQDTARTTSVQSVAQQWATQQKWKVTDVTTSRGETTVQVTGWLPAPDTDSLVKQLVDAGIDPDHVHVELVPSKTVDLSKPKG